jgi:hypothetical protein
VSTPLSWPDPRVHDDGEPVTVSGTVGRVILEATSNADLWGEFELNVEEGLPPLRCVAFPTALARLDVALVPLLEVDLTGRLTRGPNGLELHVREWKLRIV